MTNKTLIDSITSLQAQNLKITKLVEKLTAGTPAVENHANQIKDEIPPWDTTRYFWSHRYNICTGHNSATCTTRNTVYDTTTRRNTPKEVPLGTSI